MFVPSKSFQSSLMFAGEANLERSVLKVLHQAKLEMSIGRMSVGKISVGPMSESSVSRPNIYGAYVCKPNASQPHI